MNNADKSFIIDEILSRLNSPQLRALARMKGKEVTIRDTIDVVVDNEFPQLITKSKEEIAEELFSRAKKSKYPEEPLEAPVVKLNMAEIFLLGPVCMYDLIKTTWTLEKLATMMAREDDVRTKTIVAALNAMQEIMASRAEQPGNNL